MALISGFTRLDSSNNTFSDWFNKTNEIIDLVREDIITANSNIANTGGGSFGQKFARLHGEFSANGLYAQVITGGDIETTANLEIASNTLFSDSSVIIDLNTDVGRNLNVANAASILGPTIVSNTLVVSSNVTIDTNTLFINSVTDLIGIGTLTPVSKLQIQGLTTTDGLVSNGIANVNGVTNITGNLVVDTATLFVDSVLNRVGVGTATPLTEFQVLGVATSNGLVSNGAANVIGVASITGNLVVDTTTLFVDSVLNRVGVGTSTPTSALQVVGTATINTISANIASITGNLVVDTTTLFVDSVLNRVGIGTASPSTTLEVNGAITANGLSSNGTVNIANTLTVSNNVTLNQDLTVVGNTNITQNLNVSNSLFVTGNLDVTGGFEFSGDLTIDNITVTGTANIASLEVGGLVANGVAMVGTSAAVATNAITTIDSFDKTVSRGLKYIIQGNNSDAASAYTVEIMCAHNNTTAFYTRYAEVKNNFDITIEPIVSGSNVLLRVTCPSAAVSNTHFFNIMRLETR